jgi:5'-nucleotidase/UDP-sugar diphosphatase
VRMGVLGLTIDSNNRDWQSYDNLTYSASTVAQKEVAVLKNEQQADFIVALTHWDASSDVLLSEKTAGLALIVGGHEHAVVRIEQQELGRPSIYKADSNVRTVWVHELWIDTTVSPNDPASFIHKPRLVTIDSTIPTDPEAEAKVLPFVDAAYTSYRAAGFEPTSVVAHLPKNRALDLRMTTISSSPQPVTSWFAQGVHVAGQLLLAENATLAEAYPGGVDVALFNVGSLRLDDVIGGGSVVTQYSVMCIAPFANRVQLASIRGNILQRTLDTGFAQSKNYGGILSQYLAYTNVTRVPDNNDVAAMAADDADAFDAPSSSLTGNVTVHRWLINGAPLDPARKYVVALSDYLLGLGFAQGPVPYTFLSPVASAEDVQMLVRTDSSNLNADARRPFIRILSEQFPPSPDGPDSAAASLQSSWLLGVLLPLLLARLAHSLV